MTRRRRNPERLDVFRHVFRALAHAPDTQAWAVAHKDRVLALIDTLAEVGYRRGTQGGPVPTHPTAISSIALYPSAVDGHVYLRRYHNDPTRLLGAPWPGNLLGQTVCVETDNGWTWTVHIDRVEGTGDATKAEGFVLGDGVAQPMPPVVDGGITLPNMNGHAHARSWRAGDVIQVHEQAYRVGKPVPGPGALNVYFPLTRATDKEWLTRPGRMDMPDERSARQAIGSAVVTPSGEWLRADEVKYREFTSAIGRSRVWMIFGKHLSADKAQKLNATHPYLLSAALSQHHGTRIVGVMPPEAVVLTPKDPTAFSPTGERLALVDRDVWHERVGDPELSDGRRHYIVRIDDPELSKRARAFIKAGK